MTPKPALKKRRPPVLMLSLLVFLSPLAGRRAHGQDAADESTAYTAWYAASEAKEMAKAYALAGEYLAKFPSGQYAEFLKKWLGGARGALFNEAIKAKDMDAMLRVGKERLAESPDDLDYVMGMALNLRINELFANPPRDAHAAEVAELSERAIDLIEGGKLPTGADPAKWKKDDTLAWLYQNQAIVAMKQDRDDNALQHFEKSTQLAATNPVLKTYNALYCGSLRKQKYDAAVARLKALPEAERGDTPSEAAKAVVAEANREADAAIDCWARFIALAETQNASAEVRTRIGKTASDLYAYRNPQEPEGFRKLVDGHKQGQAAPGK